jgi:hypothetical protein
MHVYIHYQEYIYTTKLITIALGFVRKVSMKFSKVKGKLSF